MTQKYRLGQYSDDYKYNDFLKRTIFKTSTRNSKTPYFFSPKSDTKSNRFMEYLISPFYSLHAGVLAKFSKYVSILEYSDCITVDFTILNFKFCIFPTLQNCIFSVNSACYSRCLKFSRIYLETYTCLSGAV